MCGQSGSGGVRGFFGSWDRGPGPRALKSVQKPWENTHFRCHGALAPQTGPQIASRGLDRVPSLLQEGFRRVKMAPHHAQGFEKCATKHSKMFIFVALARWPFRLPRSRALALRSCALAFGSNSESLKVEQSGGL